MTSILKVDTIQDQAGNNIINESSDTITIGASGDTVTIPSGATISNLGTASGFGVNTPAFEAYFGSNATISDDTETTAAFNTEAFDTNGCYDNVTNYRFTPTVAGKYFCYSQIRFNSGTSNNILSCWLVFRKNGNYYHGGSVPVFQPNSSAYATNVTLHISSIIDLNGSTDYVDVGVNLNVASGTAVIIQQSSLFGGYKIIE
jgi:hypothetical protein